MNLFAEIRSLVIDSLQQMQAQGDLPDGLSFEAVTVEPPRDAAHGDMATNAAMVFAKPAKCKPRDIAAGVKQYIPMKEMVKDALCIVLVNIKARPIKIANMNSVGMILKATNADKTAVALVRPWLQG